MPKSDKRRTELAKPNLDKLKAQVQGFLDHSWRKHRLQFRMNVVTVLVILTLGGAVTLLGAFDYGHWSAVVGVAISVVVGIQNAFKFGEKAALWEAMHREAKEVRDRLNYKVRTEEEFQAVLEQWLSVRRALPANMPGVGEVQGLGHEEGPGRF
jgi:hypothetical protein